MNFRNLFATAALVGVSFAASAQAPTPPAATPGVDQHQANQEKRIDQGVATGKLTRRETRKLEREQNAINRVENNAKADGTVSRAERRRLHAMQRGASKDIRHQKHDAQVPAAAPTK